MKFRARVKTDTGEWIVMPIRAIFLDEKGRPERVTGATGIQYNEFELEVSDQFYGISMRR